MTSFPHSVAAQPLTMHINRSDKLKVYMDITWHTPDVQLDSFCCSQFFFELVSLFTNLCLVHNVISFLKIIFETAY